MKFQMLSMRNGLNLHPMCVPGGQGILHPSQLSQMGIDIDNGSGSYDINMTTALNTIPETSNTMLNLSNQSTSSLRPYLPIVPPTINSEAMSFDPESCVPANFSSFQLRNSPQVQLPKPYQLTFTYMYMYAIITVHVLHEGRWGTKHTS